LTNTSRCTGQEYIHPRKSRENEGTTPQHKEDLSPQPATQSRLEGRRRLESTPRSKMAIIQNQSEGMALHRRKERDELEVRTIMEKTKTLRRGDRPPDQDPEEPRRDTKGRRIPEENESEDKNVTEEDRDDNATTEVPQQEETQVQDKKGEQGENEQEQETESDHAEQENNRTEEGQRR
jgi:hypothetical protein